MGIEISKLTLEKKATTSTLFQVRVTQTKKTNTNHFMPGLYDFYFNYCELANEASVPAAFGFKTLNIIFPNIYQQIKQNLKRCPILVIDNSTDIGPPKYYTN
jgi:hypothetical protein